MATKRRRDLGLAIVVLTSACEVLKTSIRAFSRKLPVRKVSRCQNTTKTKLREIAPLDFQKHWLEYQPVCYFALIIKVTISSIVIGLKNSYFPLIHLPSDNARVAPR